MTKEGETVDPIIEVSCMNEKKYTTAKDDIGAAGTVQWNEHIFFEPRNVVSMNRKSSSKASRLNRGGKDIDQIDGQRLLQRCSNRHV